jgi:hypothetical protein
MTKPVSLQLVANPALRARDGRLTVCELRKLVLYIGRLE